MMTEKDVRLVPRVARSLDDLRVGQVVAIDWSGGSWKVGHITEICPQWSSPGAIASYFEGDGNGATHFEVRLGEEHTVVILAEPPEPDYIVPRAAMDALRETWLKVAQHPAHVEPDDVVAIQNGWLFDRVGDLLYAATVVEDR